MRVSLAAFLIALGTLLSAAPVNAQDTPPADAQAAPADNSALRAIIETELPPERMALAMKIVELSGTTRIFDEVLPTIADQAKNQFIRANPQMQLGIIAVVDKIAVQMVSRRPELDRYLARVWASEFSDEQMQELVDFFSSETGKRFSQALPQVLAVQTSAAQEWGKSVGEELNLKVQAELRAAVAAETEALQSDIAGPSPAPQPAP